MSSRGAVQVGGHAGAAFAALTAALDEVGQVEWWQCSDGELAELVRVCGRAESRCAAAGVAVLAEAAGRGLPVAAGAKDGAGWFRGLVPVTPGVARARAGLALGRLGLLLQAWQSRHHSGLRSPSSAWFAG